MPTSPEVVFDKLRKILRKNAGSLSVSTDTAERFVLSATPGQATVKAWGGKMKKRAFPVAWVEIGKSYVSFHLMPLYGNPKLAAEMSEALRARMQGKSCLNFKTADDALFTELDALTARGLAGMKRAGFVAE